jgi:hypothetical protein
MLDNTKTSDNLVTPDSPVRDQIAAKLYDDIDFSKFPKVADLDKTKLGLASNEDLLCSVRRVRQWNVPGVEAPAANEPPKVIGGDSWIDPQGTTWKATIEHGKAEVVDANGKTTKVSNLGDKGEVEAATVTNKDGKQVASIGRDKNGALTFSYKTEGERTFTEQLEFATLDKYGNIIMKTSDGRFLEQNSDGSFIQRNKDHNPTQVKDANGNHYKLTWESGYNDHPVLTEVDIDGPSTKKEHLRYVKEPGSQYFRVYAGAQDKPSTWYAGAGIGAGEGVQAGVGVSLPLQDKAMVAWKDGKLFVEQSAATADSLLKGGKVQYEFRMDGTTVQTRKEWLKQDDSFMYTRDGSPPSSKNLPQ